MIEVFQLRKGEWVTILYACQHCNQTFKTTKYCSKHEIECERINTIKKQKEQWAMPVQRIYKNGEVWYRWGDSGKLYKDKADAEKQGRAAYAAGYREPK